MTLLRYPASSRRSMFGSAIVFSLAAAGVVIDAAFTDELSAWETVACAGFFLAMSFVALYVWATFSAAFDVDGFGISMHRFGAQRRLSFEEIDAIRESPLGGCVLSGRSGAITLYSNLPDYHATIDYVRRSTKLEQKVALPLVVRTSWLAKLILAQLVIVGASMVGFGIIDQPSADLLDHLARPIVILLGLASIGCGLTMVPLRFRIDRRAIVEIFLLRRKRYQLEGLLSADISIDPAKHGAERLLELRFRDRKSPLVISERAVDVSIPALYAALATSCPVAVERRARRSRRC